MPYSGRGTAHPTLGHSVNRSPNTRSPRPAALGCFLALAADTSIAAVPVAPWLSRSVTSACAAASHVSEVGPFFVRMGWGSRVYLRCARRGAQCARGRSLKRSGTTFVQLP
jgi:hypothetical protein